MSYKNVHVKKHDRSHPKTPSRTVHVRDYDRRQQINPEQESHKRTLMAGKPPADTSDDSPYPIKYKPMEYEILDWAEVEYGDEDDRKRIEEMAARNPDPGTIRILARGGVIDDIQNLPPGWNWEILDHDEQSEEGENLQEYRKRAASKPDPYTVRVVMQGGVVEEIQNMPKSGWLDRKMLSTGLQDLKHANDFKKGERVIGRRGADGGDADGFGPGKVLFTTVGTVTVQHDRGRIDTYPKQWVRRDGKPAVKKDPLPKRSDEDMKLIKDLYERDRKPKRLSWMGRDYAKSSAHTIAGKLNRDYPGEGWKVETCEWEPDRYQVVRYDESEIPKDMTFEEYRRKYNL